MSSRNYIKNAYQNGKKNAKKSEKWVTRLKILVCTYKSKMIAQRQLDFARTHVHVLGTHRNPTEYEKLLGVF